VGPAARGNRLATVIAVALVLGRETITHPEDARRARAQQPSAASCARRSERSGRGSGGTNLGALGWFVGVWVVMMAATMLPSLVPTAPCPR
jgi:hypothetical protein